MKRAKERREMVKTVGNIEIRGLSVQSSRKDSASFTERPKTMMKFQKSGSGKLLKQLPGAFFINKCIISQGNVGNELENTKEIRENLEKLVKKHAETKQFAEACKELIKISTSTSTSLTFEVEKIIKIVFSLCSDFKSQISIYKSYKIPKKHDQESECNFKPLEKPQNHSADALNRIHTIEKQQLFEKISLLESYIAKLTEKYETQHLQAESAQGELIQSYKNSLSSDFQSQLKEKDRKILHLQFKISEKNREISQLKGENIFRKRKQTLTKLNISEIHKVTENFFEKNKELNEQVQMLSEELRNFLSISVVLQKTQEQLRIYQRRCSVEIYNKIDLVGFEEVPQISPDFFDRILKRQRVFNDSEVPKRFLPHLGQVFQLDPGKKYVLPYKNWLEVTIRGLLDSKYIEHLCCIGKNQVPTSFTEFSYAWLGTFFVDQKYREIKLFSAWKRGKESGKKLFIGALADKNLKNSWEIDTFKRFFAEELQIDDLDFFLSCRFLLFKGPELETSHGKYLKYGFINIDSAVQLVEKVFSRFPSKEINDLKVLLRNKAKRRALQFTISSSYVLRIMLECFLNEKKEKIWIIKRLFQESPKSISENHEISISFENFKAICVKIDSKISQSLIIRLYRESFYLGNGVISFENFCIAANEFGLFFKTLRCRKNLNEEVFPKEIETFNDFPIIKSCISRTGLVDILEQFEQFSEILRGESEKSEYFSKESTKKYLNSAIFHFSTSLSEVFPLPPSFSSLPSSTSNTLSLFHDFFSLKRLKENISVRKIQFFWKQKKKNISKP